METQAITLTLADNQPQSAPVFFNFHLVATLNITAEEARRRVNRQVVPELGTGLLACPPELNLAGEQVTWRVPVVLSLPTLGTLGEVGAVAVDAYTGEIQCDAPARERMVRHARWLYHGAILPAE